MTFKGWLQEVEVFSTREQRLHSTFAHMDGHDWYALMEWLEVAYDVGYRDGKEDKGVPF